MLRFRVSPDFIPSHGGFIAGAFDDQYLSPPTFRHMFRCYALLCLLLTWLPVIVHAQMTNPLPSSRAEDHAPAAISSVNACRAEDLRHAPAAMQTLINELGLQRQISTNADVRMVYLVPSDKATNPAYVVAMGNAIRHLQIWYRNQLGNGKTFKLHTPVVEVYHSTHPTAWFSSNSTGAGFSQFYFNAAGDGFTFTGGRYNDPDHTYAFYVDADPVCGQCGGCGGSGVLVVSANDLRGLVGGPWVPTCPGDNYTFQPCRFVGGLGHELGHAFGLPHPPGCDQNLSTCDSNALMWAGFYSYPSTYLRPDNLAVLNQSNFFDVQNLPQQLPNCQNLALAATRPQTLNNYLIRVSPNPAGDQVGIETDGKSAVILSVINSLGQVMCTQAVAQGQLKTFLPTAQLARGLYVVRASSTMGEASCQLLLQ